MKSPASKSRWVTVGGGAADGDDGEADDVHAGGLAVFGGLRGEEVGDGEETAFALAGEGDAGEFPAADGGGCGVVAFWIVDDDVVAFALRGKVAVDGFGFEPVLAFDLGGELVKDGAEFFVDEAKVVGGGGGLELPLIFEEGGLVDEGVEGIEVEVFADADAEEGRLGDVVDVGDDGRALGGDGGERGEVVGDGARAGEGLDGGAFGEAGLFDGGVFVGEIGHDVEAGEGVFGVEDGAFVLAAEIIFDIFAREGGAAADDGESVIRCVRSWMTYFISRVDLTSRPERPMASALWSSRRR